jgi:hypothetical protein
VLEAMSCNGEILEITVGLNNISLDNQIKIRSKVFLSGNSYRGNFVPKFCLGHKFPIVASYWAKQPTNIRKHEIKLFSANDYKFLFSYFAKMF